MAWECVTDKLTGIQASADLSTKQYLCLVVNSDSKGAINTGSGSEIDGILQNKPLADEACEIATAGVSKVVAGAAITAGTLVMSDTAGKAVAATSGLFAFGRALETVTADGQVVAVLLNYYGNI